jgi:hypothetical protein
LDQNEGKRASLDFGPLRMVLLTQDLGTCVKAWQYELGLPESGISQQAEGVLLRRRLPGATMSLGQSDCAHKRRVRRKGCGELLDCHLNRDT